MKINSIIICTVDREPEYIHQTLAGLLFTIKEKKEIHLVVDGTDYKHYSTYKDFCKIYLNKLNESCDNNIKRAAVNYARCLLLSKKIGGLNLILEDDVFLSNGWEEKLNSIDIKEDDWALSLNNLKNKESSFGYEKFYVEKEIPQRVWCKSYAVVYSPKILEKLSDLIVGITFYKNTPYDLSLGGIVYNKIISMYECCPGLVQRHLGIKSSVFK